MEQDYFENMAASILQRMDSEVELDESVVSGPYYFNENYGKQNLNEAIIPMHVNADAAINSANDPGSVLNAHIEIAAHQIIDAFLANKPTVDRESLLYITDPDLLSAISRKTTQLHSILRTAYNQEVAREHIEQSIRRQIKYLAYNV